MYKVWITSPPPLSLVTACRPSGSRTRPPGWPGRAIPRPGRASSSRFPAVRAELAAGDRPEYRDGPRSALAGRRWHEARQLVGDVLVVILQRYSDPTTFWGAGSWARRSWPRGRRRRLRRSIDWEYNAWGGGYPPFRSTITTRAGTGAPLARLPLFHPGHVLEGGAIDGNGRGHCLLTTEACLLNPNRNPGAPIGPPSVAIWPTTAPPPHVLWPKGRHRRRRHRRPHRRAGPLRCRAGGGGRRRKRPGR